MNNFLEHILELIMLNMAIALTIIAGLGSPDSGEGIILWFLLISSAILPGSILYLLARRAIESQLKRWLLIPSVVYALLLFIAPKMWSSSPILGENPSIWIVSLYYTGLPIVVVLALRQLIVHAMLKKSSRN
jgi:hypothetical protein